MADHSRSLAVNRPTPGWSALPPELARAVFRSRGVSPESRAAAHLVCRSWAAAIAAGCKDLPGYRTGPGVPGWGLRFSSLEALEWHGGCPPLQDVAGELRCLTSLTTMKLLHPTDEQLWAGLEALPDRTTALDLEHSSVLTDAGVAALRRLASLTSLTMRSAPLITSASLSLLWPLGSLTSLSITGSAFKDTEFKALSLLTALTSLELGECSQVSDNGLKALASSLPRLATLELACCERISDAGMGYLSAATSLTSLNLSVPCQVTDEGLSKLRSLTGLEQLRLSDAEMLHGSGLSALKELTRLSDLTLSNCYELDGESLAAVSTLTSLTSLDLSGNEVEHVPHLDSLSRLTALDLSSTNITDESLEHLYGNTILKKLALAWCGQLTDDGLGQCVYGLRSLNSLDLSYMDAVEDHIIHKLKLMENLENLGLMGCNSLTEGCVMHCMQFMTSLKRLHLGIHPTGPPEEESVVIKALAEGLQGLVELELKGMDITDADAEALLGLPSLTGLHLLNNPRLSDEGVMGLSSLRSLKELTVHSCSRVTDAAISALRRDLPSCRINMPVYYGV